MGGAPTAKDVVPLLEATALECGGRPIVWMGNQGATNRDLGPAQRLRGE